MRATIVVCLLLGSILSAGINGSFRDNNSYIADIAVAGNRKNAIDDEKLVLAFYYAWYRNDGWWRYWPLRAAHHPVLGAYNSSDPKVIAQHIKWAKEAGIDGFIVSWWGINSIANNNTRKIIEIANREDFTITIYYETTKTMGKTDEDAKNEIIDEITYIIDTYSDESCFLRFENRPVIFVYALWTHTRYFWENVTKALREKMNIFLIGDGKPNEYPYFDGYHLYNPKDIPPESLLNSYKKFKEFFPTKLLAATVIPGFDNRKIKKDGSHMPRYGGRTYNEFWNVAVEGKADWVLITSWNEWWEGSEIEPSWEYKEKYLELTRKWSNCFKNNKPLVYFKKPVDKYLYVFDREVISIPFRNTIILGGITVEAEGVAIDKVEFYIDDVLRCNDTVPPYEWLWNELAIGRHEIKVIAYDSAGNRAEDKIKVIIFNWGEKK